MIPDGGGLSNPTRDQKMVEKCSKYGRKWSITSELNVQWKLNMTSIRKSISIKFYGNHENQLLIR
jgi:hypothetical protein